MTHLANSCLLTKCSLITATALLLQGCAGPGGGLQIGEYGCDLNVLHSFYTPPQKAGESNYFIDMQGEQSLRKFALAHGLTNNHALFVVLHGMGIQTPLGARYAFYPAAPGNRYGGSLAEACFSIRDLAAIIGPADARNIHNLVLAACNRQNTLSRPEIRAYFPNVTNLTYATPKTAARLSTFQQALTYHSRDIQFLCALPDSFTVGVFDGSTSGKGKPQRLVPYVAELYLPGAKTPFATQTAGRELLQPGGK